MLYVFGDCHVESMDNLKKNIDNIKLIGCEAKDNCVKLPYHLGSQTKIKEDKDLQKWIKKYNRIE